MALSSELGKQNRSCLEMMAKERLKKLMQQPDNRVCADCGAPDPKWA